MYLNHKRIACLAACISTLNFVPVFAQSILTDQPTDPTESSDGVGDLDSFGFLHDAIELIDERVAAGLARDGVGGATVGIIVGNKLAWTKSYGFADEETATPASRDTVYPIASITKSFTGLMLAQLAEKGVLRYSDPAAKFLPELDAMANPWSEGSPITLLQIANMTAGIQREPDNVHAHGYLDGPAVEWKAVTLRAMLETRILDEPGTRYAYSNMGYAMLGVALGRAAEIPFIDYQLNEIIRPLGMDETAFTLGDELRNRFATGYIRNGDGSIDTQRTHKPEGGKGYGVPSGGLYSTVDDLAKFVMLQLGRGPDGVIGLGALGRTHTGFQSNGDLSYGYGIGLTSTRYGDTVLIGNLGGLYGFASAMYFDPKTGVGLIVLRNATGDVFREDKLCFDALELVVKKLEPEIDALIADGRSAFESQRWDEAVSVYASLSQRSLMERRDSYQYAFSLYAQGRDLQAAIRWFRISYELGFRLPESAYYMGSCYAILEDPDQAFNWLIKAREAGANMPDYIANDPNLSNLHSDPRFEQYLSQFPAAD